MLGSKLPLFPYNRGHQPNSRGLYTHYKDSLLKGWMTIPNTRSLDPGCNILSFLGRQIGSIFRGRIALFFFKSVNFMISNNQKPWFICTYMLHVWNIYILIYRTF